MSRPARSATSSAAPAPAATERRATSYLVRLWHEDGAADGAGDVRGFVRNLRTGAERYFVDPAQLVDLLGTDPVGRTAGTLSLTKPSGNDR